MTEAIFDQQESAGERRGSIPQKSRSSAAKPAKTQQPDSNSHPRTKQLQAIQQIADRFAASRPMVRFQGLHPPTGITPPVQRVIIIGEEEPQNYSVDALLKAIFRKNLVRTVPEADAIEEVLDDFSADDREFDTIEDALQAAREELGKEDEEDEAEEEPVSLSESDLSSMHKSQFSQSGKQANVQAKMVAITHMVKGGLLNEQEVKFSSEALINGLCGGWTQLFLRHPDWVEPVYNAVRSWRRPKGLSDPLALASFEKHLSQTTKFKGAGQVLKLLGVVFEKMGDMEPEAGYTQTPDSIDQDLSSIPEPATTGSHARKASFRIRLRGKNAAKAVIAKVQSLTRVNAAGECMAHIESDLHHMALRVQKIPIPKKPQKQRLLITVVESEKMGMQKVNRWDKAEQALNAWLSVAEPDLKEITVNTSTVGFSG